METIRQSFDGMRLKKDCLEPVLAEYGYKRTEWVLATTLQELSWDGRFSRPTSSGQRGAVFRRTSDTTPDHRPKSPAILDGFVDLYRKAYQESWACLARSIASVTVPSRITSVRCWCSVRYAERVLLEPEKPAVVCPRRLRMQSLALLGARCTALAE